MWLVEFENEKIQNEVEALVKNGELSAADPDMHDYKKKNKGSKR